MALGFRKACSTKMKSEFDRRLIYLVMCLGKSIPIIYRKREKDIKRFDIDNEDYQRWCIV